MVADREMDSMVMLASHKILMDDKKSLNRLGVLIGKRNPRLKGLKRVEEMLRKLAPLPCSYDIGRMQQPYFNEFSYTEMMGGLLVAPQSSIAQHQLMREVLLRQVDESQATNVANIIERRLKTDGTLDKYLLNDCGVDGDWPQYVVFPPGTNAFARFMSKELLSRLMFEDERVMIKPHPLTDDGMLRILGREFGYHRLLDPNASGWDYLMHCSEAWICSTTELGLYAAYLGKPINNLGNFFTEGSAVFNAFYREIWKLSIDDRRSVLLRMMANPCSGWLHPDFDDLESRIKQYFEQAMNVRLANKPLIMEIQPTDYQDTLMRAAIALMPPRKGQPPQKGPPPKGDRPEGDPDG